MIRKISLLSVLFCGLLFSCNRIDSDFSQIQNSESTEDTNDNSDEDGGFVDPYPHVELKDTLRIECQGKSNEEEGEEDASKTYLDASNHIYWNEGDRIKIYYANGSTNYTVSTIKHGDQTTSTFDALVDKNATHYYAFYPEGVTATMTNISETGAFEVVIPTTQDGKFENCHLAVAKASAESRSFSFKNIASYMKFVVDDLTATSLTLSARNAEDAIVGTLVAPFTDEAGTMGALTLQAGTGSSSVTIQLPSNRTESITVYVALLPGVNFSQGFRLNYNYASDDPSGEVAGPGFIYTTNRSIIRKKILNVGLLSTRIHNDWFVKTGGTVSDPSEGGNSWDNALNAEGLAALLALPVDANGVQDDALAYDKACMLDGSTIHVEAGDYVLSELKLSANGYTSQFKVKIVGSYPAGMTGTTTSATRDVTTSPTNFKGDGTHRILLVEDKVDLAIDKVCFSGGRSAGTYQRGTAINVKSTAQEQASKLSLVDCAFQGNIASGSSSDGGALSIVDADAYLTRCSFIENECGEGQLGGAIYLYDNNDMDRQICLESCHFQGNSAGSGGGAIACSRAQLIISGTEADPTTFTGNNVRKTGTGAGFGGALLVKNESQIQVEYTNFTGNYGDPDFSEGGAVLIGESAYGSFSNVSFVGTGTGNDRKMAVRNGAHISFESTVLPAQATTFTNCSFTDGYVSNVAGAIHIMNYADVSFERCDFCSNESSTYGGAVHINSANAQAVFNACNFGSKDDANAYNSCVLKGGALSMEDGTVEMTACNFYGNRTTSTSGNSAGGCMALYYLSGKTTRNPQLTLNGCTIQGSQVAIEDATQGQGGGAISVETGFLTLAKNGETATSISNCTAASASGGAVFASPSSGRTVELNLTGAEFSNNSAQYCGGAIHFASPDLNSKLVCTDCSFTSNSQTETGDSGRGGGAIHTTGGDLRIYGCQFSLNSSYTYYSFPWQGGGAVQITGIDPDGDYVSDYPCKVTIAKSNIQRTRFERNSSSSYGGGVVNSNSNAESVVDINDADFIKNTSERHGGGLYWHPSTDLTLESVRFDGNVSMYRGDAIAYDGKKLTMTSTQPVNFTDIDKCYNCIINHTPPENGKEPESHTVIHANGVTDYTFTNFAYKDNTSNKNGSLIHINGRAAKFAITGSWLEGNTSKGTQGGLIYVDKLPYTDASGNPLAASTIQSTLIKGNRIAGTDGIGGAVYWNCNTWNNSSGTPALRITGKSSLIGNIAQKAGSAIYLNKGYVFLDDFSLNENTFDNLTRTENTEGGAIYMAHKQSKVDSYDGTLNGNVSTGKGGVFNFQGGRLFVRGCQMDNNSAYVRGGVFFLCGGSSYGFVLVQNSSFVGNYVRNNGDRWGKFVHANNAGDETQFMCTNSTIADGTETSDGALINGSINLLLYGCTVLANNNQGALRVENGRSGLLLNNLLLNLKTDKPSITINSAGGGYNFNSLGGYNVVGNITDNSGSSSFNETDENGNQTGKTTADLGSWPRESTLQGSGHARYYTWDGKVSGTPVATPAIDNSSQDYLSAGLASGFNFAYTQCDAVAEGGEPVEGETVVGGVFDVDQTNIGNRYMTGWAPNAYYKDIRDVSRTYEGHYPGSYTK